MSSASRQGALPLLPRSYGLMRRPHPSRLIRFPLFDGSLQVVTSPCWNVVLATTLSAIPTIGAGAWTLTPNSLWCPHPFLPRELQPQPRCTYFGASSIHAWRRSLPMSGAAIQNATVRRFAGVYFRTAGRSGGHHPRSARGPASLTGYGKPARRPAASSGENE